VAILLPLRQCAQYRNGRQIAGHHIDHRTCILHGGEFGIPVTLISPDTACHHAVNAGQILAGLFCPYAETEQ